MNLIERVRSEILEYFDETALISGSESESISPCGKYRLTRISYRQNNPELNWNVARYKIYDAALDHLIFEFFANEPLNDDAHIWITKDSVDFLVCAEDRYGGHSIFDLTNRRFESFSDGEDGFIAVKYIPSPDLTKLALYGCYWAYPFGVMVVSFESPMNPPWPELAFILQNYNEDLVIEWIDDSTLRVGTSVNRL